MRHYRALAAAVAAVTLAAPLATANMPASAAQKQPPAAARQPGHRLSVSQVDTPSLPAPPLPGHGRPVQRSGYRPPTGLVRRHPGTAAATGGVPAFPAVALAKTASPVTAASAVAAVPARGVTWGSSGSASTLVVYDSTNSYGWLGELYAIAAGNLAGHFGKVTAEPVVSYVPGQLSNYTATIYIGSTYNEPIPTAFLNDVLATTQPVIWAADNVWQLSGAEGSPADQAFKAKYGWDPSNSYFDTTDNPLTMSYKGQTFSRNANSGAQVLAPSITNPAAVTVLAQANCTNGGTPVNCAPIAQTTGTSFPWAIRSASRSLICCSPRSRHPRRRPIWDSSAWRMSTRRRTRRSLCRSPTTYPAKTFRSASMSFPSTPIPTAFTTAACRGPSRWLRRRLWWRP